MRSTKVVAACIFNKLQAAGLLRTAHTDPSTSGRKYRNLVNKAFFIRNESLVVSAVGPGERLQHVKNFPIPIQVSWL